MAGGKNGYKKAYQKQQRLTLRERLHGLMMALRVLLSLLLGVLLLWLVKAGYQQLDRPVALVSMQGNFKNVTREELARWIEPAIDSGMVSLSLRAVKEAMEEHPWIAEANISRRWPNSLLIEVVEEFPLARWGETGFLNRRGESLAIDDSTRLQALPLLVGPEGAETQLMDKLARWSEIFTPAGLKIVALKEDAAGRLQVELENAPRLVLGRDDFEQKIQRFLVVWRQRLREQADNVEQVDLRYGNGLAVRWRKPGMSAVAPGNRANEFSQQTGKIALLETA